MEELLDIPENVNKKSKEIFEKCFQVKLDPDDKLDYYLWHNDELSIIVQRTNVTITFVFKENGKIRFTIKKRKNEKSLLQGEFVPLEISNPEMYIERLIGFFK